MSAGRGSAPRPPLPLRVLGRLLIRGRDASLILRDLDESFAHDVKRGMPRGRAVRRHARNVAASVWSVWTTGVSGIATHGLGLDTKLGLRMLAKQPLVTLVAVLALGIGIPASLTVVHGIGILFSDLPIPEADRVVGIRHFDVAGDDPVLASVHDYERWAELSSFASIAAVQSFEVNLNAEESGAAPVAAARITASAFPIVAAEPLLGRVFDASDERVGAPDVVLLGEDVWEARFGRDPDIVGRTVRIGRTTHTVVGVMPSDFQFPLAHQVWLPLRARAADFPAGAGPGLHVFGRLADGVSAEVAAAELTAFTEGRASEDAQRFEHLRGQVVGLPYLLLDRDLGIWSGDVAIIQTLIFGLLVVVCGNVGTLILARTAARSSEITIRNALGASRARILTQLFIEALVLSVTATGLGLILTNALAGRVLLLLDGSVGIPYWVDPTLTPQTIAIALGLAALCAVLAGVVPAIASTRRAIQANLQSAGTRTTAVRFGFGSSALIMAEIVLSVGFLALGTAVVRSMSLSRDADLGFDPARYVVGTLTVPEPDPMDTPDAADSLAWARRVVEVQRDFLARLAADPAVANVGLALHAPGLSTPNRTLILETPPEGVEPVDWDPALLRVDVSFFSSMDRPILAGRDFTASDVEGPAGEPHKAVIVNESFVRHQLGGRNAIGQRLRYQAQGTAWGALDEGEWYEIVGVVGAFGTDYRNPTQADAIYHPLAPGEVNPVRYVVEVAGDPEAFAPRFREIAASVDREAMATATRLAAQIESAYRLERAMFIGMVALAGIAFLLSATGLYALISFTVSQRTREIGIRTALGARPTDVAVTVARRAAIQVGVGLALGVVWGWVLLTTSEFDIDQRVVPLTLVFTALVGGSVCVLACARPTLRGLRVQPTEALRET